MALKVLVLHGSTVSLNAEARGGRVAVDEALTKVAHTLGLELKFAWSNAESVLIDELERNRAWLDAVLVNPGAVAPVAYGLADALALVECPCVEVLLAHESKGRGKSALRSVVARQFHGKGFDGYEQALKSLAKSTPVKKSLGRTERLEQREAARTQKSLGRRAEKQAKAAAPAAAKTLGRGDSAPATAQQAGKTLGRAGPSSSPTASSASATRAPIIDEVRARLAGRRTGPELAAWARTRWLTAQAQADGSPESVLLEEVLLQLSSPSGGSDDALLAVLGRLES